jgi:hypothetical protein
LQKRVERADVPDGAMMSYIFRECDASERGLPYSRVFFGAMK